MIPAPTHALYQPSVGLLVALAVLVLTQLAMIALAVVLVLP